MLVVIVIDFCVGRSDVLPVIIRRNMSLHCLVRFEILCLIMSLNIYLGQVKKPLLTIIMDEEFSIDRCSPRFGCYGMFATLPLRTAVINRNHWNYESLQRSLCNPLMAASCKSYLQTLSFPGSDFFTFEELAFLMQVHDAFLPRTVEQIESDRRELTHEGSPGERIFRSHAQILLKAINFWELQHAENWEEWRDAFLVALADERRRENIPSKEGDEPVDEGPRRRYPGRRRRRNWNNVVDVSPPVTVPDFDEGYGSS
jgi:hypothetical protein